MTARVLAFCRFPNPMVSFLTLIWHLSWTRLLDWLGHGSATSVFTADPRWGSDPTSVFTADPRWGWLVFRGISRAIRIPNGISTHTYIYDKDPYVRFRRMLMMPREDKVDTVLGIDSLLMRRHAVQFRQLLPRHITLTSFLPADCWGTLAFTHTLGILALF